jgi:O-antigen/teichoic acid export membrane protein
VAGLLGLLQARVAPNPGAVRRWLSEQRDLAPRYLAEFMALSLGIQLFFFALGAISGLVAVGSIRAGALLLGPLGVLYQGVANIAVPESVRLLSRSARDLLKASVVLGAALALATLAWGATVALIPHFIGSAILRASWGPGRRVLVPLTIGTAGAALVLGGQIGLRALAAARRSLRSRLLSSFAVLVCGIVGALVGGVVGAAWGQVVGVAVGVTIWWHQLLEGVREHTRTTSSPPEDVAPATATDITPLPGAVEAVEPAAR